MAIEIIGQKPEQLPPVRVGEFRFRWSEQGLLLEQGVLVQTPLTIEQAEAFMIMMGEAAGRAKAHQEMLKQVVMGNGVHT